jgi:TetR/AcrR family transcriptional regulator, copper-responsive repressor
LEKGRPRGFDPDQALDRALEVFWRDGFQGASLSTLTHAMGINKPSLYAAFGDKASLYLKALQRYGERETAKNNLKALRSESDARRAIESFMRSAVQGLTDPSKPGGCFVVNGSADCGLASTPEAVQDALRLAQQASESAIRDRLKQARKEGQLPPDADIPALAAYFAVVMAGLSVQAKAGAPRPKLDSAVGVAMQAWPARTRTRR